MNLLSYFRKPDYWGLNVPGVNLWRSFDRLETLLQRGMTSWPGARHSLVAKVLRDLQAALGSIRAKKTEPD